MTFKEGFAIAAKVVEKNLPAGLIVGGVIIGGLAVVSMYKATHKADEALQEEKERMCREGEDPDDIELTTAQKVVVAAPKFAKTAALVVVSCMCILGGNHMHILRNASLAAAVVAARADEEKAIKRGEEIMKKAREVLGKEKADEIKQAVAADTVENAMKGVKQSEINGMRGNGLYPVVDVYGHVFYSTVHEINAVETECNNSLFPGKAISRGRTPDYCSDAVYLQDIYELFKNGGSTVYASQHYVDPDDVGEVKFKIGFSSYGDQEEPCITLDYGCEFYPLKSKHGRY